MSSILANMTKRLTIKEAIEYFNLSEKTIRRRIKSGKLNAEKQGNQWVVLANEDSNGGQSNYELGRSN